jgi:hypothetical protein
MERIPADTYAQYAGHCDRYRWAADLVNEGETVNDVACGSGYGSTFFPHAVYRGYDRAGVPSEMFPGEFHEADLDNSDWEPSPADASVCFETLEHVIDPAHLAQTLVRTTRRVIFVSVPVVPTTHMNGHHLHDFTREDVPLLFPGLRITEEWAQPEEMSHVWRFEKS